MRECWLIDPAQNAVTVIDLTAKGRSARKRFADDDRVQSMVLPTFRTPAREVFI